VSRSAFLLLILALSAFAAPSARGQAIAVDDSGSQVLASTLKLKWDDALPRNGQAATLSGTLTVRVRLDVAPLRGRRGRIYQVLPAQSASPIRASWTSGGVLLPGALEDGQRALVYAGPIDVDVIEDTLRLTIQAQANRLSRRQEQLHFAFEFEPDLP
jgi:hypothetical protein